MKKSSLESSKISTLAMNKEELKEYLRENLSITAGINWDGTLEITLVLDGEPISFDYVSLPENR